MTLPNCFDTGTAGLKPVTFRYENEQLKEELQATATRQQNQIETLAAGLQKVNARLQLSKSAPQSVLNN